MADEITVLDLPEITDVEDNDVIYVIRGTGAGRDKKQKRSNFLKDIKSDTIASLDTDGVNFTDVFGYNIDAPVTQLHLNESTSGTCLLHFTNLTTGAALGNGFNIGLDASENAVLHNKENTSTLFYTNNLERMRINNSGEVGVGTNNPGYKLEVAGKTTVKYTGDNYLSIQPSATGAASLELLANGSNESIMYLNNLRFATVTGEDAAGFNERMRLDSSGKLGIGVDPSTLLHIQSTTTPQFRIAYDTNSYVTQEVANGGDFVLQCQEATGLISLRPGVSNALVDIYTPGASASLRLLSSDAAEYGLLSHDGTNLLISTGGTSAGNVFINNTTESTSKDTGALVVEGGLGVEKNIWAGGTIKNTNTTESTSKDTGAIVTEGGVGIEKNIYNGGLIRSAKGRYPTGWLQTTSITENDIFDAIDSDIPTTGEHRMVSGIIREGSVAYIVAYMTRTSSIVITFHCGQAGADTTSDITVTDGNSNVIDMIAIAW